MVIVINITMPSMRACVNNFDLLLTQCRSGTMLWLSDKRKRSYTGNWQDGFMEGYGEMTYADHSIYTGWWHRGKRSGHGRMEYKLTESTYNGSWESDMRSGYGIFDNGVK